VLLIIGTFIGNGIIYGQNSNEQITFTFFMISKLIPIIVGNYFRSKNEALLVMSSVKLEKQSEQQ
jgi:hypothetical protein